MSNCHYSKLDFILMLQNWKITNMHKLPNVKMKIDFHVTVWLSMRLYLIHKGFSCLLYPNPYLPTGSAWLGKPGICSLLGTTLSGFRGCNPPGLMLSQSWDHKPRRRQSLSPWQKCHLYPLHSAWPWAWPVSQWWVRILKGGST